MDARLLIVGLAPGVRGANRTGRPFTGDFAGDLLYRTLLHFGLAQGRYLADPEDGLTLVDCRVTNAVRCVPPANLPTPAEIGACNGFLATEIAAMPRLRGVLALGGTAHNAVLRVHGLRPARMPFRHGTIHTLSGGARARRQLPCVAAEHEHRPVDRGHVSRGGSGVAGQVGGGRRLTEVRLAVRPQSSDGTAGAGRAHPGRVKHEEPPDGFPHFRPAGRAVHPILRDERCRTACPRCASRRRQARGCAADAAVPRQPARFHGGEVSILLHFPHHVAPTSPYRAGGPIFVREGVSETASFINHVPEQQRIRLLSVRAYDAAGIMVDADVQEGSELETVIERMFRRDDVAFLHAHNARRGCYSCRIDRI